MDCRLLDTNADFGFCSIILSNLLPSNSLKLGIEIRQTLVFDIHLIDERPPLGQLAEAKASMDHLSCSNGWCLRGFSPYQIITKSLFGLRLTRRFHQNQRLKLLQRCSKNSPEMEGACAKARLRTAHR